MEVIHIILGKANPERMNGVNKVVFGMASEQMHFGEKVIVWGIAKDLLKNYKERNFETQLFLKSKNPFKIPSELKKAILEKKDTAVFHFHGGWIPIYFSLSNFLQKHAIPFVLTPHGAYNIIAMQKSFWLKKIYFRFLEKKVLEKAAKIHCLGQSEITGLNSFYTSDKVVLLPYGYELNGTQKTEAKQVYDMQISFAAKKQWMSDIQNKEELIFGFIGRLDIYTKGLDELILGFERFVKTNPNSKLWIIGDSNQKDFLLQMIADKELTDKIIFFGSKFGKHKETLLQNIDVFVHPSRNEGLPTSVIEAAGFGKPCIVSSATNIGTLIETYNAGKMIEDVSSKKIEKAMLEMYQLSQKPEAFISMRYNAIRMIKENFNWNKIISDYKVQLYS